MHIIILLILILFFELRGVGQRSEKELLYLSMNAFCWNLFLQGFSSNSTYKQVADIFKTLPDTVRFGFERKNHDFGQRELCRFGLDLYIAIYQRKITLNDEKIISSILNESINIQMRKRFKSIIELNILISCKKKLII